jgi:branched-chain amino acid transport system permease protein
VFVMFVLVGNVRRSPTGRRLLAVRANERASAAGGIDVPRTKLIANIIGGVLAATAGVLLAYKYLQFTSQGFEAGLGLQILALAYLGGVGSARGALIAGALAPAGIVFQILPGELGAPVQFLMSGVGLILVCLWLPGGLADLTYRAQDRLTAAKASMADELDRPLHADNEVALEIFDVR